MGALLRRTISGEMLYSIVMSVLGILMVIPFLFMISMSFKYMGQEFIHPLRLIPAQINWDNYKQIFHNKDYFQWYWNSIRIVVLQLFLKFFIVTAAAYAFARLQFRFKNVLFLILMSTIMIPSDTTVVARYFLYKYLHIINTQWVIILPAIFEAFFIFLMRQFFLGIPKDLTEAAIIDGCNHFQVYYRIMLPLAVPGLVTMILFSFIWTWNDFVNPFIFINDVHRQMVTVGLQYFQEEMTADYPLQLAGATIVTLVPMLLFAFTQRFFVEGVTMSGIKG